MSELKALFDTYDVMRMPLLDRARQCAALTIPSVLPPESSTEATVFETPYQGVGARGVNTLGSKLLLTLLPPNTSFFRYQAPEQMLQQLPVESRPEVEQALIVIENAIMKYINHQAYRTPAFEMLKSLIIAGNNVLQMLPDGRLKSYRFDQYVVRRDSEGNLLELIVKEVLHFNSLPEDVQDILRTAFPRATDVDTTINGNETQNDNVELYTDVKRQADGKYKVYQEIKGIVIPDTLATYDAEDLPWLVLRWTAIPGESYGRSMVEEYLGDLKTLEALTKAITEGAIQAARVVWLVNPTGLTKIKKLAEAKNGDVIPGIPTDAVPLQLQKQADFVVAQQRIAVLEERLSSVFLLLNPRNAERVTAEEIRRTVQELEDTLGGVYSVLAQEFQLPFIKLIVSNMKKNKELPPIPKEVKPTIVSGIDALGRGQELNKLMGLVQTVGSLGPEAVAYLDMHTLVTRLANALNIKTDNLVKTTETLQMEQANAAMAQAAPQMAMGGMQGGPA